MLFYGAHVWAIEFYCADRVLPQPVRVTTRRPHLFAAAGLFLTEIPPDFIEGFLE